jgi:hypothetical protein
MRWQLGFLVAMFALGGVVWAQGGTVAVDGGVRILCGPEVAGPVREAANDLAGDMEKVFGVRPRMVTHWEDAGAVTLVVGEYGQLPEAESFSISVAQARGGTKQAIVLAGPDVRGTMYAVYQFSQEYLGVDPMYYWTDQEPARRERVEVAAYLHEEFAAPVFKYRGFFLNDEDLLTGWAPGDADKTGISLAVWNKIYETILRLKGNMVVPGSWIFPDDAQVGLAGRRGLIVNQHHATPLGLNAARWPKDVVYNYTTHPEILERAWKNAVAEYDPKQEVLWTVGLRGLSDVSYAAMDPSGSGNDKARGALIGKAIRDQMGIVRAVHPDAKFATDLWSEATKLVQEGYLKIPPEVTLVWADNGYGFPQDKGEAAAGQGIYYHVAMMNSRSNQLTEMVPVERIVTQLGRYTKAGATGFLLLNTSDIRPVAMTARAVMEIGWKRGAAVEFGAGAAPALREIYKEYFSAPVQFGPEPLEYGDQLYHQEATQMMLIAMLDYQLYFVPGQAPKWDPPRVQGTPGHMGQKEWMGQTAAREVRLCGEAQGRWDAVWEKAVAAEAQVEPERRPYYRAQVLAMIGINRESNRILTLVSEAIQFADKGQKTEAQAALGEALKSFDEIDRVEGDAEYGKWKGWYRGDWLTDVKSTRATVEMYARFLDDPLAVPLPIYPRDWEAYYHIMHYEGDRTVDVR